MGIGYVGEGFLGYSVELVLIVLGMKGLKFLNGLVKTGIVLCTRTMLGFGWRRYIRCLGGMFIIEDENEWKI